MGLSAGVAARVSYGEERIWESAARASHRRLAGRVKAVLSPFYEVKAAVTPLAGESLTGALIQLPRHLIIEGRDAQRSLACHRAARTTSISLFHRTLTERAVARRGRPASVFLSIAGKPMSVDVRF
jgi:hypothetical protein